MTADVAILLLAAGQSSRMRGGDKTLEEVSGQPLLRHLARECLASDATKTLIILPPDKPKRARALDGLELERVEALEAHQGMSASLKEGLKRAGNAEGVLIVLADMPLITRTHLNALIAGFDPASPHSIIRAATASGQPGHPVLFGQKHFEALAALTGDQGARDILAAHKAQTKHIILDGDAAITDLDTPEDWAHWRRLQ